MKKNILRKPKEHQNGGRKTDPHQISPNGLAWNRHFQLPLIPRFITVRKGPSSPLGRTGKETDLRKMTLYKGSYTLGEARRERAGGLMTRSIMTSGKIVPRNEKIHKKINTPTATSCILGKKKK